MMFQFWFSFLDWCYCTDTVSQYSSSWWFVVPQEFLVPLRGLHMAVAMNPTQQPLLQEQPWRVKAGEWSQMCHCWSQKLLKLVFDSLCFSFLSSSSESTLILWWEDNAEYEYSVVMNECKLNNSCCQSWKCSPIKTETTE